MKFRKTITKDPGLSPGTLIYTGTTEPEDVSIDFYDIGKANFKKNVNVDFKELKKLSKIKNLKWINVSGLGDISLIKQIGDLFKIDSLVLEDIVHVDQRPKMEAHKDHVYIVMKMFVKEKSSYRSEQISIIMKDNLVLTFQERKGDVFDPIRERLKYKDSRLRKKGSDFLTYALIDIIVDNYFVLCDLVGSKVDSMDGKFEDSSEEDVLKKTYGLKQENSYLRKKITPVREVVGEFERKSLKEVKDETRKYLRDVYDHMIIIIEILDNQREIITDLLSQYQTNLDNKLNETMKVLTVISTIFIPLSFIVGLYGMNFKYMPELHWKYGYFIVLGFMVFIFTFMIIFFKRKKWI